MGAAAVLGRVHGDLEPALVERIRAARRADPAAPVTILVGSNLLAAYLRRTLAANLGGLFNVRTVTFSDLVSILAPGGAAALPPAAELAVLEDMIAAGAGRAAFGNVAALRGFAPTLLETFDDLAEGGCTAPVARALAKGREGTAAAVLSLFADYRVRIESLGGDAHSRFVKALDAAKSSSPGRSISEALGSPAIAYGFYDFNEMQWRLLDRLASTVGLEILMPWGETEGYRFAGQAVRRLEGVGAAIDRGDAGAAAARSSAGAVRGNISILNLPGEEEEVREIARRILTLARDGGARFGEIAVIVPSVEGYPALVREIFDEAGIPWYAGSAALGAPGRAAASAASLLGLVCGPMERRELVEFLSLATLREAGDSGRAVDKVSLWVRRSADAGIIGESGWGEEAGVLVRRLETDLDRGKARTRDVEAARRVEGIVRRITSAREEAGSARTWTAVASAASNAVRDILEQSLERDEACAAIERLGDLDRLGIAASPERFLRAAVPALEGLGAKRGRLGEGVALLTYGQARGLGFRATFLSGLAERMFPAPARQDPFLGDAERLALAADSRGAVRLAARGERIAEEALLFCLALESASEETILTYPRFEQGTGKEKIPSSFLRFAGGAVGTPRGAGTTSAVGPSDAAKTASSTLPAQRIARGTALERGVELVSLAEYDFERARLPKKRGGAPPDDPLFERGAALVRGRWGAPKFTEYDGVFRSKLALDEMRRLEESRAHRFSPTGLERYASCPFEYFLARVLGLEELEEPERVVTISPADRGSLIHRILARMHEELKRGDLLPIAGAPVDRVDAIARLVTERLLAEAPGEWAVGLPVFWELEKRLVREAIRLFLDEERLETEGYIPAEFERSFGRREGRDDVAYERGALRVRFHGWIDRIDTASGGRFRVIDYKTGKLAGRDQDLAGGTSLQLPIYLLAAARLLDLPVERGEAMLRHVGVSPDRRPVRFLGRKWGESEEEFANILEVSTAGIEKGLFFAPASDEQCRNCGVSIACSSGMQRLFERKASADERVLPWLRMRGIAGEEEEE